MSNGSLRVGALVAMMVGAALSGCGPSGPTLSEQIEVYCESQAPMISPAPARTLGAACTGNGDCDSDLCATQGTRSFCTTVCGTSTDCPAAIPSCTSAGGVSVCTPTCAAGAPVAGCVNELEVEVERARLARCVPEVTEWIDCLALEAPFCTAADRDAACGSEEGRYTACVMAL